MTTDDRLQRMLLWFESQLPPHEVTEWYINFHPERTVLETHSSMLSSPRSQGSGRLRGYGSCKRCGKSWHVGSALNNWEPWAPSVGDSDRAKEQFKQHVLAQAAKEPCWGDVPHVPEQWTVTAC